MNHTIVLDSYDYAEALKAANVPEAQIKVEVARDKERTKAINEIIDNNLATKSDLIIGLKELELKIEQNKNQTIKWICGFITLATAILGLLIKFNHY